MKKVTMRGKRTKPSYMSDDEGDLGEQSFGNYMGYKRKKRD